MSEKEPLIVKYERGYGWGSWQGKVRANQCCVVARALRKVSTDPMFDSVHTALNRKLSCSETLAVNHLDWGLGSEDDRLKVEQLAKAMGVEL